MAAFLFLAALAFALDPLAPWLARAWRAARLRELCWRQEYMDRIKGD